MSWKELATPLAQNWLYCWSYTIFIGECMIVQLFNASNLKHIEIKTGSINIVSWPWTRVSLRVLEEAFNIKIACSRNTHTKLTLKWSQSLQMNLQINLVRKLDLLHQRKSSSRIHEEIILKCLPNPKRQVHRRHWRILGRPELSLLPLWITFYSVSWVFLEICQNIDLVPSPLRGILDSTHVCSNCPLSTVAVLWTEIPHVQMTSKRRWIFDPF